MGFWDNYNKPQSQGASPDNTGFWSGYKFSAQPTPPQLSSADQKIARSFQSLDATSRDSSLQRLYNQAKAGDAGARNKLSYLLPERSNNLPKAVDYAPKDFGSQLGSALYGVGKGLVDSGVNAGRTLADLPVQAAKSSYYLAKGDLAGAARSQQDSYLNKQYGSKFAGDLSGLGNAASFGLDIAGLRGGGALIKEAAKQGLAKTVGKGMLMGGGYGAGYGVAQSAQNNETDLGKIGTNIAMNTALGAGFGGGLPLAGAGIKATSQLARAGGTALKNNKILNNEHGSSDMFTNFGHDSMQFSFDKPYNTKLSSPTYVKIKNAQDQIEQLHHDIAQHQGSINYARAEISQNPRTTPAQKDKMLSAFSDDAGKRVAASKQELASWYDHIQQLDPSGLSRPTKKIQFFGGVPYSQKMIYDKPEVKPNLAQRIGESVNTILNNDRGDLGLNENLGSPAPVSKSQAVAAGTSRKADAELVQSARNMVTSSETGQPVYPKGAAVMLGQSKRKFAERLSEDPTVPTPVQEGLSLGYNRKPNVETMQTAANDISARGADTVAMEINAIKGAPTDAQGASGQLLIRHYIDSGQIEKAIMIANKVSKNFTEAGRAVQIAQAHSKLTPDGALRDVMTVINKANEKRPQSKQITLTPEQANTITKLATDIETLTPGSREHQKAIGLLKKAISESVPPTLLRKIATFQTIMQLLNPKTGVRNVLGNMVVSGLENTAGITAAGIDKAISLMPGYGRTTTLPQIGVQLKSFGAGVKLGVEDVKLGIRTNGALGQTEVIPNVFKNKILHALEQATGYSLSVPDKGFYQAAFDGSVTNQLKAQGLTKATREIEEQAANEALYRTFQNNSKIAETLSSTKKFLNAGKDFGMGDLLLKYPKTPGNILSVGLDYSPVGFVKGLAQFASHARNMSPNVQRDAVMNISRGLTGTGLIVGGAMLAQQGIITAKASSDKDKAAADKYNGQGPFAFHLTALQQQLRGEPTTPKPGDLSVNYDWLQPNSMQLSMGANLVLNHKDAVGLLNNALESFDAASSSVTQQPILAGVAKFVGAVQGSNGQAGSVSSAVGQAIGGAPASFIPTLLNQIGQTTDTTARNSYDPTLTGTAINQIKGKIPGLRKELQPRVGIDGQEVKQYDPSTGGNSLFNVFLNPAFVTRYKDNPIINEVNRLFNATGETKQYPVQAKNTQNLNGINAKLTSAQLASLQKNLGGRTMTQFNQLINSDTYKGASDSDKVNILSNALTSLNAVSKLDALGGDPSKLDKSAKALLAGGDLTAKIPKPRVPGGSGGTTTITTRGGGSGGGRSYSTAQRPASLGSIPARASRATFLAKPIKSTSRSTKKYQAKSLAPASARNSKLSLELSKILSKASKSKVA